MICICICHLSCLFDENHATSQAFAAIFTPHNLLQVFCFPLYGYFPCHCQHFMNSDMVEGGQQTHEMVRAMGEGSFPTFAPSSPLHFEILGCRR